MATHTPTANKILSIENSFIKTAPAPPPWESIEEMIQEHYRNPDLEAARVICAILAGHGIKDFPPAWCLAIAPPGSMKTDLLEAFRGLKTIHFVDEVTPNTFLSGKIDEAKGRKRKQAASLLHRIGKDGVIIASDFSTFTSNPKQLGIVLSQLRRIYDGNFSREFGTDENMEERAWSGRLTMFAGATPNVDKHFSVFQELGERFVRVRWPRAGGAETAIQAMRQTAEQKAELRHSLRVLLEPLVETEQEAPLVPPAIEEKIAHLGEFVALCRTYVQRHRYTRDIEDVPVTEGNTRLPQQLCQIVRGSALLDSRSLVSEEDYRLVCRAAVDSMPPTRLAVLQAIVQGKNVYRLDLADSVTHRTIEDLTASRILANQKLTPEVQHLIERADLMPNLMRQIV